LPTYEYRCESCGNQYEKREGFSAPSRQKCPRCSKTANRILHAPPIVFKGSGFYKTDSRGSSSTPDAESRPKPSEASPTGPSTDSGATETAAAT